MDFKNKHIVVVGLGKSGVSVARWLKKRGAVVTVTDSAEESKVRDHAEIMRNLGIRMELGDHRSETFDSADGIVLSPGVPHTLAPIERAKAKGIPVLGEIELASRFIREPMVAVTGTNGKTTVTTLLGQMLNHSGISTFVGGNIGNPLIDYVDSETKADVIVAEISSFQLDTIEQFRPTVAVLLNITEDHLDRYPDFNGYVQSKARIFENQKSEDTAVLNADDPPINSLKHTIRSRTLCYSSQDRYPQGAFIDGNRIEIRLNDSVHEFCITNSRNLGGKHNLENTAAAILAAMTAGATPAGIQSAIDQFKCLPHRIQYAGIIKGVVFYDDSKGTNMDAVVRALDQFGIRSVILIMGGRGKGGDSEQFRNLIKPVQEKVKKLIAMGETKNLIHSAFSQIVPTTIVTDMNEAVQTAFLASSPGDVVLLSPGYASFDMFKNYAERGQRFCEAVEKLHTRHG